MTLAIASIQYCFSVTAGVELKLLQQTVSNCLPFVIFQAKVKPRCGRLVGFSAGVENLHGVLGIKSGRRCAVALWFTMREKKDETARYEAMDIIKQAKEKIVGKDQLKHTFASTHIDL